MPVLRREPLIYEINTLIWIEELGRRHMRPVTLSDVPPEEWEAIASRGFDAVWLMGVWERSPEGRRIARSVAPLLEDCRNALPDFTLDDIQGSPYCIADYVVDGRLGGPDGLARARAALSGFGLSLILDFVPNHTARDHRWVAEHPEYFIQGDFADLERAPDEFFQSGDRVFALGRDPNYPPWADVAQLNAFHPGTREAAVRTLLGIAAQCDAVRCDMSILLINAIFRRTWGSRAGMPPEQEFWEQTIRAVRSRHPEFSLLAEAYWGLERELMLQGFDFCYDKCLYDHLAHGSPEAVRLHLCAHSGHRHRLVRFIENHDEPRAAAIFEPEKARAAAVTFSTVPGAKLFFHGQLEGRKVSIPVQLGRQPDEPADFALRDFYECLLGAVKRAGFRDRVWAPCALSGWPDNDTCRNLAAWRWTGLDRRFLVVVNLSGTPSQGRIGMPGQNLGGRTWLLVDTLSGEQYERDGDEMTDPGLFVDLGPWGYHFFEF